MISQQVDIIILACLTAITCALPGVFLVLRRVSLMSDAISHAILLGIVVGFLWTKNLSSPWVIFGATVVGVLTVTLTELVIHTRKLKKDAAIGLVFPFLFSLGVILINKFARDVHIDSDCVLFGEIAFAPFNRFIFNGMDLGPQALWIISGVLILNILFISLFYKELKITTFDKALAASLGFAPALLNYALMTMVSITAVASFESVGSILVVALMIVPPSGAYLLTNRLSHMIFISLGLGMASAILGYGMAYLCDTNIAGSMATMAGVLFFFILIFAPERGILAQYIVQKWHRWDFASETLLVHLFQHKLEDETEHVVSHMNDHMLWDEVYTSEVIAQCLHHNLIEKNENKLSLTEYGREKAKNAIIQE